MNNEIGGFDHPEKRATLELIKAEVEEVSSMPDLLNVLDKYFDTGSSGANRHVSAPEERD